MNTVNLREEGLKNGKLKEGKCPLKSCTSNETLLYRVKDFYICGTCLDLAGKVLK